MWCACVLRLAVCSCGSLAAWLRGCGRHRPLAPAAAGDIVAALQPLCSLLLPLPSLLLAAAMPAGLSSSAAQRESGDEVRLRDVQDGS